MSSNTDHGHHFIVPLKYYVGTFITLLVLTIITVVRSLNSRNEWRKIIEDGHVEIKDKIKF